MRVLIINTSDRMGGAAIAAYRLMDALKNNGIKAKMLVMNKSTDSDDIIAIEGKWHKVFNFIGERITIWVNNFFSKKNLFKVSIANTGFNITQLSDFKKADIIHLHWVNQGMLSLKSIQQIIQSGKPIIWTMHDMWECTAICHYAYTCESFKTECKNCMFLRFPHKKDLAHQTFIKKQSIFKQAPINIVTVSNWLAKQAKESVLLRNKPIQVIPNTLSLSQFNHLDRIESRNALKLPKDKYIILFGAARIDDPIKGFDILLKAIQYLIAQKTISKDNLHLVTFGKFKYPKQIIPSIPIEHTDMGWITDSYTISQLYSAANITVSASLYETFGQTLIEAQACGCIPISFGNSGQADIITHKVNGYLAQYLSIEDLAKGIEWGLTEGEHIISRKELRQEVIQKYSGEVVAKQYIELYKKLTNKKGN